MGETASVWLTPLLLSRNNRYEPDFTTLEGKPVTHILAVDDDNTSLLLIEDILRDWGYAVTTARNGEEAWAILQQDDAPRLALLDWVMPGCDGVDLCRRIKEDKVRPYTYSILLTSKSEKEDVVTGLNAGADDFLTKPVNPDELKSRLAVGLRILEYETALIETNKRLDDTNRALEQVNRNLQHANKTMLNDLDAAHNAQQSLLPTCLPYTPGIEFAARLVPCAFVAGDMYNVFQLDEDHIGFYQVDVSGHGASAALFSVSLSQILTQDLNRQRLLFVSENNAPALCISPPSRVIKQLNETDMLAKHDHYFTMLYAVLNIRTGELVFARAGHNEPLIVRADGTSRYESAPGGCPVGMGVAQDTLQDHTLILEPGDAFIVFSDGVNEAGAAESAENMFGFERVRAILASDPQDPLDQRFDSLLDELHRFMISVSGDSCTERPAFEDDVSIVGVRRISPVPSL